MKSVLSVHLLSWLVLSQVRFVLSFTLNDIALNSGNSIQNSSSSADNNIYHTPVRYDDTQLWRVYNISDQFKEESVLNIAKILEVNFEGNIWRENPKFLDISINKDHLNAARNFLNENNILSEVLHRNIQSLIDAEQMTGSTSTEEKRSNRIKKSTDYLTSGINWNKYQNLSVIYNFMREMRSKYSEISRLYNIGETAEGRELKVMRISENPRDYNKIWIDGGIHAREWISPAVVTYILYTLLSNWATLPKHLKEKTWYIMPVMNPDGYVYSREVNRFWRKNRSQVRGSKCFGTDLNRNFDIGWTGYGSSPDTCSDTFRGASAASEKETQAVVKFLTKRKKNFRAYLTFHSYGQMIVYPWAYKAAKAENHEQLQYVADLAAKNVLKTTGVRYRASVTHEILGIAGGGSDDWCRDALNTEFVYTIELRDRGYNGFILPADQIRETAIEGYTIVDTITKFF